MSTEFADLYHAHYGRIVLQLHAYLGDLAEAQDLTQEAFCRALDRWARIGAYDDPSAWVRRVALNLATSRHRRRQTMLRFLARQRAEHAEGPGPDRVALTQALATLPEKHRRAVVQHHIGQLSAAEIAHNEGVAEGTVRSWLSRGRSELAAQFSEFESASGKALRAPGAQAAEVVVRRRRRNRIAGVAAIVAAAIAIPLALFALSRGQRPPIVDHTPPPSVSPSGSVKAPQSFSVTVPGVDLPVRRVFMVDARSGWAWLDNCTDAGCPSALASTNDGGRSWRRAALPELSGRYTATLHPLDARTAVIYVVREQAQGDPIRSFLQTLDGGASFQSYDYQSPPLEVQLASPIGGTGRFRLWCPGIIGYEDGANANTCAQQELYYIGEGPITPRPPLLDLYPSGGTVTLGADGRLWLTVADGLRSRIAYSSDAGKTWKEVQPWGNGVLTLSPDGKEVWMSTGERPVILDHETWLSLGPPGAQPLVNGFFAVGDGMIVTNVDEVITFIGLDGTTRVDSFHAGGLFQLPDGTVLGLDDHAIYIGAGRGADREWTAIRWG